MAEVGYRNFQILVTKKSSVNKATRLANAIQMLKNDLYLMAFLVNKNKTNVSIFNFGNRFWVDKLLKGKEIIVFENAEKQKEFDSIQNHAIALWKEYIGSDLSKEIANQIATEFKAVFSSWKDDVKAGLPKPKKIDTYHQVSFIANKNLLTDKRALKRNPSNHLVIRLGKLGSLKVKIPDNVQISHVLVTIVPEHSITIRIFSEVELPELPQETNRWLAIDLGITNFVTVVSNADIPSFIVNGGPVKSFNQWFNKTFAEEQRSNAPDYKRLLAYRKQKLHTMLHQIASFIVKVATEYKVDTIIIPDSLIEEYSNKKKLSSKFNQTFRFIPFGKFLNILEYKARLHGIRVIRTSESYTSKISSLTEDINKSTEPKNGKRIKRGLFKDNELNKAINADANGALNIAKKALGQLVEKSVKSSFRTWLDKLARPIRVNVFRESWREFISKITDSVPVSNDSAGHQMILIS